MYRALVIAAVFTAAAPAFAESKSEIDFDDVPAVVLKTAEETAPGVVFERVSIEIEDGVAVYEFEATSFDGKHIEIDVAEDGTLEEIELQKSLDEVPAEILKVLAEAVPEAEPVYIEASVRGGFYVYEFECAAEDGAMVDVEIDENGKVLSLVRGNLT
ncbi:MAG: PepSY domain-containing protein [Pseudomonadota bacterium]